MERTERCISAQDETKPKEHADNNVCLQWDCGGKDDGCNRNEHRIQMKRIDAQHLCDARARTGWCIPGPREH